MQRGLPNQDAHRVRSANGGSTVILAAADGHGDQRCVRADVGSQLAVHIAVASARQLLERPDGTGLADLAASLPAAIVADWNVAVAKHYSRHPWTETERGRMGAAASHREAYGSTVLIAVACEADLLLAQIGDGDILVVAADGVTRRPLQPQTGPVGGETWSVAAEDAAYRAVTYCGSTDDVRMLLMATDGYANSFASPEWEEALGADYLRLIDTRGAAWLAKSLPSWVEASAAAAGDDVTVLIALRRRADA
ncbi:MAG: PP2C family serine/threonine-protein phosphatase [Nocardioidaceae bacterium]